MDLPAEVAGIGFTAFAGQKKADQVPGQLVARRIPDLNAALGQGTLFDLWRFHAFFTTTDPAVLDTVTADKTHRQHAAIEHVHADLKEHRGSSARKPPRNRQVDHTPLLSVHGHTKANDHCEI